MGVETLRYYIGNENYFQIIDSHQKAYFLGFIAADGCIVDHSRINRQDELAINIHERDKHVLEEFSLALDRKTPIYLIPSKNQVAIRMNSQIICDHLKAYGLGYRKSLTMPDIFPNVPKQYRGAFTLGYFDGDGWISPNKTPNKTTGKVYEYATIGFCGTEEFLTGLAREAGISSFHIKHENGSSPGSVNGIYCLTFASRLEVNKIYRYMYTGRSMYLKRKHDRFIPYILKDEQYNKLLDQAQTISQP